MRRPTAEPPSAPPSTRLGFSPRHMDAAADPRRDFYRYACGGWLQRAAIPASEGSVSTFSGLGDEIDRRLTALVLAAAAGGETSGPRGQVGVYHRAAMDLGRLDALGLEPLAADLASVAAVDSLAALGRVVARHLLVFGGSAFLNVGVVPDARKNDVNALYVGPGDLTLNRHELLDDDSAAVRDLYAAHVAGLFELAGDSKRQATTAAATVFAVERELAAGTLTPVAARDPDATYHKMALADLQALLPSLDLDAYLSALGLTPPATAIVQQPAAVAALERVLSGRPPDDARTHLRWRVLAGSAAQLGQPFRDADRAFADHRAGLQESPSREKVVLGEIRRLLAHPLSRLYVEAHFAESTRRALVEMVGHVRAELRRRLQTNPWLSAAARKTAVGKLDRLEVGIGYPDEWVDYSSVHLAADDYLGNVRRLSEFNSRRGLSGLGETPRREQFAFPGATTPIDVNAAYQPTWNAIEITAAIAQPPFFDPALDEAVNYGAIGAVIGHELTHGFDTQGRRYDADGDLRDWWTAADAAEFARRTAVLVEQYGAYEVLPGVCQDGELTIAESTADLGGITLAHLALERALAGAPAAEIDGFSPRQRCFLAWAQLWMSKARPEVLRQLAATDPHPVSAFRAVGSLVHLDAFFAAFGIRAGDPTWRPPQHRVRIW